MSNDSRQADKFKEAARELETDEREDAFDRIVKKIAVGAQMKPFKLTPVADQAGHRDWTTSDLPPIECWVLARDPEHARMQVYLATVKAVNTPMGESTPYSPWINPNLVTVSSGPDLPERLPEGVILTADGQKITIE